MNCRKMFSGVVASAIAAVASTAVADTMYQALVTGFCGTVYVCNIDENGVWTLDRQLMTKPSGSNLTHAQYKNGIVYVTDYVKEGSAVGYVHKYKLDGTCLGKITVPGAPEGLAITPDGKTIFVGEFKGSDGTDTTQGRVFKIDVATETVEEFCHLNGDHEFRDIEIDDAGHLFVADRKGKLHIFNYTAAEDANVPITKNFNFCEGVAYDSASGKVTVAGNDLQWGQFDSDDQTTTAITLNTAEKTDAQKSGWCVGATVIDGKIYFASYSEVGIMKLNPEANEGKGEFTRVYPSGTGTAPRYSGLSPLVRDDIVWAKWAFDEANGTGIATNDLDGSALDYYDDVRVSTSGVKGSCAILAANSSRIVTDRQTADLLPETGDFAIFFWVGGLNNLAAGTSFKILSNAGEAAAAGDFSLVVNNPGTDNTLGLEFTPADGSTAVSLASTADVGDAAWHYVGAVRRGTALELWMDGVRVASATVAADKALATGRTWTFAGYTGACFDELEVTTDVPLYPQIAAKYQTFTPPATLPTVPALPTAQPMPSDLGVELAHVYANQSEIAMPSLLVDGDTYYATVETGNERYDANRKTVVMKSTDQGATWTKHSEIAAQSASLFLADDATLCLVGLEAGSGRTVNVWTNDATLGWQEAATYTADYECRIMPSPVVIFNAEGLTTPKLAVAVAYMYNGRKLAPAVLRFEVSGHTFSAPTLTVNTQGKDGVDTGFVRDAYTSTYTTQADVLGGNILTIGKNILMMYPVVDRHSVCPAIPFGPERAAYQNFLFVGGTWSTYRYNQFRGGSKPFNIRYDSTARQTFAVTVPSTSMSEIATADPESVVGKLALYASPNVDKMAWYPCGTLLSSEIYGFVAPTFAFDGNDLIVLMAVSAPDGCGVRGKTHANYLAFKRFANFRTAYPVQTPAKSNRSRAYIVTDKQIFKYYRTSDGEWQPDGCLVQDLGNTKWGDHTLTDANKIVVRGKRIFVLTSATITHFLELDLNGTVVNGWALSESGSNSASGFDIDADCTYALVAKAEGGVYRVDLADKTWTKLVTPDGTDLVATYDVAIIPNSGGDFFASDYDWNEKRVVRRYNSAGTLLGKSVNLGTYLQGVAVNAAGDQLYVGDTYGTVSCLPVADISQKTVLREAFSSTALSHSLYGAMAFETLFVNGRGGFVWAYDPATSAVTAPFSQVYKNVGLGFYEHVPGGLSILIR